MTFSHAVEIPHLPYCLQPPVANQLNFLIFKASMSEAKHPDKHSRMNHAITSYQTKELWKRPGCSKSFWL